MKIIDKFKSLISEVKRYNLHSEIDAIYRDEIEYIKTLSPAERKEYLLELCTEVNDYPNILADIKNEGHRLNFESDVVKNNLGGYKGIGANTIDDIVIVSSIVTTTITLLSFLISYKLNDQAFTIETNLQALATSAIASALTTGAGIVSQLTKPLDKAKLAIQGYQNNQDARNEYVHNKAYKAILRKYGVDPASVNTQDEQEPTA